MVGTWAEYWAVAGSADTQRYLFRQDGHFGWAAPVDSSPNVSIRKQGRFEVDGGQLVLHVEVEDFAACAGQCQHSAEGARRVRYRTPIVERAPLGECAHNEEAQQLDTGYACRAIGGRAFWRQGSEPSDSKLIE